MENRIMMRRRLIAELKQDAKKAEGGGLQKRYSKCKHCGTEGCEAEHETEAINEATAEPEQEISPEALSSLLTE